MFIQRVLFFTALVLTSFVLAGVVFAQQPPATRLPNNSPFNNGVRSPADFASIPSAGAVGGGQTLYFSDDLARLPDLRHYRVVSSSTVPTSARPRIVGPSLEMPALGTAAKKSYLRLAVVGGEAEARQFVFDFYETNKGYVDANFVLRQVRQAKATRATFVVDLGPFANDRHARLFCTGVLRRGTEDTPCDVGREYQSRGERASFQGKATVGLSMPMVQQAIASNKQLDFATLYAAELDIEEGETLGRSDHLLVKIMRRGLFLAREDGTNFLLPADTIPMPMPPEVIEPPVPASNAPRR